MFNFNLDNKKVIFGALAGVAVAAIGLIVVYKDVKAKEEEKIQKKMDEEITDRQAQNDMDLLDKKITKEEHDDIEQRINEEVKLKYDKKAQRKAKLLNGVVKVGLWANENKATCVGFTTLFGTATAVVAFVNGIREFGKKSKIQKQLDRIEKSMYNKGYSFGYNDCLTETVCEINEALADKENPVFEIWKTGKAVLKVKVSEAA